jgi:hypothetical protein
MTEKKREKKQFFLFSLHVSGSGEEAGLVEIAETVVVAVLGAFSAKFFWHFALVDKRNHFPHKVVSAGFDSAKNNYSHGQNNCFRAERKKNKKTIVDKGKTIIFG